MSFWKNVGFGIPDEGSVLGAFGIGRGAPNTDPSSVWYTKRVFSPMYYERKRKREEMENGEDDDDA